MKNLKKFEVESGGIINIIRMVTDNQISIDGRNRNGNNNLRTDYWTTHLHYLTILT